MGGAGHVWVTGRLTPASRRGFPTGMVGPMPTDIAISEELTATLPGGIELCHQTFGEPGGEPVVENGIALCKLHHAAFDSFFIGIRPDHIIEVRHDILEERDGPMLSHGLQGLHGGKIHLPRSARARPSAAKLQVRYSRYLEAGQAL